MNGIVTTAVKPDRHADRRILLWILLFLAASEFVIRGPVRCLEPTGWNDLAQYYASSRLWLRGQNFASPENFVSLWHDEVKSQLDANTARTHIAPPPGALVFFAPLSALPWRAAVVAWLAILLAAFAMTIWSLIKTFGFHLQEPRTIVFIAASLALAPFHTGVATANQTIVVVGLCALGVVAASERRDVTAGLLFGMACSLKPHIAAFLVLYYLVMKRWRLFATAVGFTFVLAVIAIVWMRFNGVHWQQDFLNNLRFGAARNKIDDFTTDNPIRFLLINLQVPFYSFTHNARSSNLLAFAVGVVLLVVWVAFVIRARRQEAELLGLSTVAVIGLLPLYHRFYDASVLVIPLCWALSIQSADQRKAGRVALLLMAPFLLPTTALLQQAVGRGYVPEIWSGSWWWDCFVMPHQTWLLLALALVLLYAMSRQRTSSFEPADVRGNLPIA